jgi:hypothetical protein
VVNEGTVNQVSYGYLNLSEGGVFENLGTYNLNAEKSLWQLTSSGSSSTFVNKGTRAALLGAAGTAATDGAKKLLNPCFDLRSALLQDLLVTLAAALPGGLFEITAARLGPELGPVARRAIQALLDAPGLAAEEVHAARGG